MFDVKAIILIIAGIILGVVLVLLIKNKNIKTILSIISIIIFALTLIIATQKIIYKDNRVLNCYLYRMSSGSMANTLMVNDYILVMKTFTYKENDIITFIKGDKIITHRIIRIEGDKIITKGDSNFKEDEFITNDRIIGKVILYGDFLNAIVLYLKYLIISFVTTFLVAQLYIKNDSKDV